MVLYPRCGPRYIRFWKTVYVCNGCRGAASERRRGTQPADDREPSPASNVESTAQGRSGCAPASQIQAKQVGMRRSDIRAQTASVRLSRDQKTETPRRYVFWSAFAVFEPLSVPTGFCLHRILVGIRVGHQCFRPTASWTGRDSSLPAHLFLHARRVSRAYLKIA
jgi:hypothetical protein